MWQGGQCWVAPAAAHSPLSSGVGSGGYGQPRRSRGSSSCLCRHSRQGKTSTARAALGWRLGSSPKGKRIRPVVAFAFQRLLWPPQARGPSGKGRAVPGGSVGVHLRLLRVAQAGGDPAQGAGRLGSLPLLNRAPEVLGSSCSACRPTPNGWHHGGVATLDGRPRSPCMAGAG